MPVPPGLAGTGAQDRVADPPGRAVLAHVARGVSKGVAQAGAHCSWDGGERDQAVPGAAALYRRLPEHHRQHTACTNAAKKRPQLAIVAGLLGCRHTQTACLA